MSTKQLGKRVRKVEKWVLNRKELHLGFIKETFRAGAVIEVDEARRCMVVDGRRFPDMRDLEVLRRQAANNPEDPWILPYSEEAVEFAKASVPQTAQPRRQLRPDQKLQVVKSDEDLMEKDIDISDTQVSRKSREAKEAARAAHKAGKGEKLEVIRGDESVEERIASLKGKNDIASMAERVRLKASGSARMPVTKDDSLGSAGGSKAMALNAGQVIPSRAQVEARTPDAKAKADARKREAEARRRQAAQEAGEGGDEGVGLLEAEKTPGGASRKGLEAENAALRARIAALESKAKRKPVTTVRTAKKVVSAAGVA